MANVFPAKGDRGFEKKCNTLYLSYSVTKAQEKIILLLQILRKYGESQIVFENEIMELCFLTFAKKL
jgi:hypothetical protein